MLLPLQDLLRPLEKHSETAKVKWTLPPPPSTAGPREVPVAQMQPKRAASNPILAARSKAISFVPKIVPRKPPPPLVADVETEDIPVPAKAEIVDCASENVPQVMLALKKEEDSTAFGVPSGSGSASSQEVIRVPDFAPAGDVAEREEIPADGQVKEEIKKEHYS